MAQICVEQLDNTLANVLGGIVKNRLFTVYGRIPNNVTEIVDSIDDATIASLNKEVEVYYDGMFDDDDVVVNIDRSEYAKLLQ